MKKIILMLLIMALVMSTGCVKQNNYFKNDKLSIVVTNFAVYDWLRQIIGDNIELTMLMDNGVDSHSYQPTADDIITISDCDLFVYIGGQSESWADDVLKNATNKDMKVVNLLNILADKAKLEEDVEGMQKHDDEHEKEYDEHVWLSLKNAELFVKNISDVLEVIDPENKDSYILNCDTYLDKLSALDEEYQDVVNNAKCKTVLFADRFPFRYLIDDYGLNYYAAFGGCSTETDADFETIIFLINKVDELKLSCILTIEGTQHNIAETIISNTVHKNIKILSMNSMQSLTTKEIADGITYISVMQDNLAVLKEALN